jgi:hypothetical protein
MVDAMIYVELLVASARSRSNASALTDGACPTATRRLSDMMTRGSDSHVGTFGKEIMSILAVCLWVLCLKLVQRDTT